MVMVAILPVMKNASLILTCVIVILLQKIIGTENNLSLLVINFSLITSVVKIKFVTVN